jgi:hypothetical protein
MTENPHPLDPATADEYLTGRKIMAAAGLLADPVRFAYYGLEEPPKQDVLSGRGGGPADRRLRAFPLTIDTGAPPGTSCCYPTDSAGRPDGGRTRTSSCAIRVVCGPSGRHCGAKRSYGRVGF